MTPMPIIRLEVEHLKHCVLHAFTEYQLEFDTYVKEAVEKFCDPANVQRIVEKAADTALRDAIHEQVTDFFKYGAGREAVKQAVEQKLHNGL